MFNVKSIVLSAAILAAGASAAAAQTVGPVDTLGAIVTAPLGIVVAPFGASDARTGYADRGIYEGRSVYRVPRAPGAFYNESDEKGDLSGDGENPQLGGE